MIFTCYQAVGIPVGPGKKDWEYVTVEMSLEKQPCGELKEQWGIAVRFPRLFIQKIGLEKETYILRHHTIMNYIPNVFKL